MRKVQTIQEQKISQLRLDNRTLPLTAVALLTASTEALCNNQDNSKPQTHADAHLATSTPAMSPNKQQSRLQVTDRPPASAETAPDISDPKRTTATALNTTGLLAQHAQMCEGQQNKSDAVPTTGAIKCCQSTPEHSPLPACFTTWERLFTSAGMPRLTTRLCAALSTTQTHKTTNSPICSPQLPLAA